VRVVYAGCEEHHPRSQPAKPREAPLSVRRGDMSSSYSYSDSEDAAPRKERKNSRSSSYSSSPDRPGRPHKEAAPRRGKPEHQNVVLHVQKLTRNVNAEHLREIFGHYGSIENVELAVDHTVGLPKGYAYIEFVSRAAAEDAIKHMDGGEVDSNRISVSLVGGGGNKSTAARDRPGSGPVRSLPPPNRGYNGRAGGGPPRRGRSPPRPPVRRDRSPPRRDRSRSPRRGRSRSPPRRSPPRRRSPRRSSPPPRDPPRAHDGAARARSSTRGRSPSSGSGSGSDS